MHDEVSETENIRKNLAIERMIIEGCEILLDTSQTFVRQGTASAPCLPCPAQVGARSGRQAALRDTSSSFGCHVLKPVGMMAECCRAAGGM